MKLDKEIFDDFGIENFENIKLKQFNVIIGENGAGKTRLLNGIKENFIGKKGITTIYAYFPDMNARYISDDTNVEYDIPLYDLIFDAMDIEFTEFVKYIELHSFDFLKDILNDLLRYKRFKNRNKTKRCRQTLEIQEDLNGFMEVLLNRQLIFDNEIMVESIIDFKREEFKESLIKMSPGELALFYLSLLLILVKHKKSKDSKIVLLLDEPELHLHPKALINFCEKLKEFLNFELCCIATHSIFVIPKINFDEIIYVEHSKVQPPSSRLIENIYNSIVGDNIEISDFIASRDVWQYYKFIVECFSLPSVVSKVDTSDEQFLKFIEYIKQARKKNNQVTILDFGAGSGRLGKTIENYEKTNDAKLNIVYDYYDKYQSVPDDLNCKSYQNINDIIEIEKKYNCVVLMNVLHEIDTSEWISTFKIIHNLLEDDGYLLIFEVISLIQGEQPYGDSGYILLRESQINILFNNYDISNIKLKDVDKTNMFLIPKSVLLEANDKSILHAVSSLKDDILRELKLSNPKRVKYAHTGRKVQGIKAREYGFLVQQFVNCSLICSNEVDSFFKNIN